jgi:hypothetical protein
MHCSDEQLLAHLDGELATFTNFRVRRHLRTCWRCRTRLAACESEVHKVTVSLDEWTFPAQQWTAEAKQRLNRRMQTYESGYTESGFGRVRRFVFPVAATAAVLIGIVGWLRWAGKTPQQLRPSEVIARISRAEQAIYVQPVHQTFSVEIAAVRPVRQSVKAKLQVWSDRETGRFASRFIEEGGALQHAIWRPSSGEEFVYRPAVSSKIQKQSPHREEAVALEALAEYGLAPAELEAAFLRWLERRSWNPISFASDMSTWTSEDGSTAAAQRMRGADGKPVLRITAQRKSHRMVAVVTMEVDSENYWPRLQTIRFETSESAVEFRLAATSIQPIRQAEMNADLFRPAPEAAAELHSPRLAAPQPEAPAQPASLPPSENPVPIDPRAIEAQFVLHQAGACLGESVRISEESGWTRVDRLSGDPNSYSRQLDLSFVLNALAELRRDQPPAIDHGARAVALRNAWAMRRLGEDFPALLGGGLSPSSREMLGKMLDDHAEAVRRELAVLGLAVPPGAKLTPGKLDWRRSAALLFDALANLNGSPDPAGRSTLTGIGARLDEILTGFSLESSGRRGQARIR